MSLLPQPIRRVSRTVSRRQRHFQARPRLRHLEDRTLLSSGLPGILAHPLGQAKAAAVGGPVAGGLLPGQLRAAYGFNRSNLDGAGQTIAIVDAFNDPTIAADLAAFDAQPGIGLPAASLSTVQLASNGKPTTGLPGEPGWALETALDVEQAHAAAPGARLLLVEANSDSLGDLLTAVDFARRQAGVSVVSVSWGTGEFYGENAFDSYFTSPTDAQGHVLQHVTFVAASGDETAYFGPEWPAVSPNVIGVGGTTVTLKPDNTLSGETGWVGSTGGRSVLESRPGFQQNYFTTGNPTDVSGRALRHGGRLSPDVAYNADPNSGVAVFDSTPYYDGSSGWFQVGGTSAGAPAWAGIIAMADEGRGAAGPLDGSSQTLYALYQMAEAGSSTYYNAVTSGFNGYYAGKGYNLVTGLGSPKADQVAAYLSRWQGTGLTGTAAVVTHATPTTGPSLTGVGGTTSGGATSVGGTTSGGSGNTTQSGQRHVVLPPTTLAPTAALTPQAVVFFMDAEEAAALLSHVTPRPVFVPPPVVLRGPGVAVAPAVAATAPLSYRGTQTVLLSVGEDGDVVPGAGPGGGPAGNYGGAPRFMPKIQDEPAGGQAGQAAPASDAGITDEDWSGLFPESAAPAVAEPVDPGDTVQRALDLSAVGALVATLVGGYLRAHAPRRESERRRLRAP